MFLLTGILVVLKIASLIRERRDDLHASAEQAYISPSATDTTQRNTMSTVHAGEPGLAESAAAELPALEKPQEMSSNANV
jgi:hypothetical protein